MTGGGVSGHYIVCSIKALMSLASNSQDCAHPDENGSDPCDFLCPRVGGHIS
jgi:hypothetical protein